MGDSTKSKIRELEDLLRTYRYMKDVIEEDEKLLNHCYDISGVSYDSVPTGNRTGCGSVTESKLISKDGIENRLRMNRYKIVLLDSALALLTQDERSVIIGFYMDDKPREILAHELVLSKAQYYRLKSGAMTKLLATMYEKT